MGGYRWVDEAAKFFGVSRNYVGLDRQRPSVWLYL